MRLDVQLVEENGPFGYASCGLARDNAGRFPVTIGSLLITVGPTAPWRSTASPVGGKGHARYSNAVVHLTACHRLHR